MISLYHVSIRFLQYVQCYNTSNRVYRIVSIKLITLVFIYSFLCYLVLKNFICNNVFVLFTIRSFATVEP